MKLDPVLDVPVKSKPALSKPQSGRPVQVTERKLYSDAWAQVTWAVTFAARSVYQVLTALLESPVRRGRSGCWSRCARPGGAHTARRAYAARATPSRCSVDQLWAFGGGV